MEIVQETILQLPIEIQEINEQIKQLKKLRLEKIDFAADIAKAIADKIVEIFDKKVNHGLLYLLDKRKDNVLVKFYLKEGLQNFLKKRYYKECQLSDNKENFIDLYDCLNDEKGILVKLQPTFMFVNQWPVWITKEESRLIKKELQEYFKGLTY